MSIFKRKKKVITLPNYAKSGDALQGVPYKRNLKAFRITGDDICKVMSGKFKYKKNPIPADAEYLTSHSEFATNSFFIRLRHPSFEEVPAKTPIPCYDAKEFLLVEVRGKK